MVDRDRNSVQSKGRMEWTEVCPKAEKSFESGFESEWREVCPETGKFWTEKLKAPLYVQIIG